MGRSKHHVTLSDGRFLKFYTAGSYGGDHVFRYTFPNQAAFEKAAPIFHELEKHATGYRPFWIKHELASLRQRTEALENIKRLAESVSSGIAEFGYTYPEAVGESLDHLDNAIFDYHDTWGKRWPKMPTTPYSYPRGE